MVSEFSNIFYYINLKGPPTPPRVNQRLPRITATAGKVFRFVIPVDTFIDTEGNTRKLELELLSSDGKNLGDVLWIGFDAEKQVRNFFSLVLEIYYYSYRFLLGNVWTSGCRRHRKMEFHHSCS